jgi:hypothetical protein
VSKQAKTVIGLVIVAVLALLAFLLMGVLIGLGVLVVGGLAVVAVMQRTEDSAPRRPRPKGRKKDTTSDLLQRATSTVEPLTTWTPPDALKPWTPPVDDAADAPAPPSDLAPPPPDAAPTQDFWSTDEKSVSDFSDLAPTSDEPASWLDQPFSTDDPFGTNDDPFGTSTESFGTATEDPFGQIDETATADESAWADGSTWNDAGIATDTNPLDDLARLDEVDVIAEFERLDERDTLATPDFDSSAVLGEALAPINEAVSAADAIKAASQATELQVEQDDNSELAKLLAKVQARLAAYE